MKIKIIYKNYLLPAFDYAKPFLIGTIVTWLGAGLCSVFSRFAPQGFSQDLTVLGFFLLFVFLVLFVYKLGLKWKHVVSKFLTAFLVSIPVLIVILFTLDQTKNAIPAIEAQIGYLNSLKIILEYGLFTFAFLLLGVKIKSLRLISLGLLIYWVCGSTFLYAATYSARQYQKYIANTPIPTEIIPTYIPTVTPTPTVAIAYAKQTTGNFNQHDDSQAWGTAQKVAEHTYHFKIGMDDTMATPQEIFLALNVYRQKHGVRTLTWDAVLANYAQSRSDSYLQNGKTDTHAGFNDFLDNQNGFQKLGWRQLGENSSFEYKLIGVHIIEWMYASDAEHDANQIDSKWTNVGIGVSGTATDLIFAGEHL